MADASCSATAFLSAHLSLIHGTTTKIPHIFLFTSHPRYSVAVLLTSPLVSTTISKRHRESGAVCLWRRSRLGSELARDISPMRVASLFFSCTQACDLSVRAGSAACRARRFRPPPPPVACRSLPHKRTASSLPCPYGEAPLVSTTKSTCDASAFLF